MARRKPVWLQKREYETAQRREEYYANRVPSQDTVVRPRKQMKKVYGSVLLSTATDAVYFLVPVTVASHTFFGGDTALGLQEQSAIPYPVPNKPSTFQPAKIHAMVGKAAPTASITPWGSRVISYNAPATGDSQAFYSAPVSSGDTTPTLAEVQTKFSAIATAKSAAIGGDYGRIWASQEVANITYE